MKNKNCEKEKSVQLPMLDNFYINYILCLHPHHLYARDSKPSFFDHSPHASAHQRICRLISISRSLAAFPLAAPDPFRFLLDG
jgi:hypothetical protein